MATDTFPCVEAGRHIATQRHTRIFCPIVTDQVAKGHTPTIAELKTLWLARKAMTNMEKIESDIGFDQFIHAISGGTK